MLLYVQQAHWNGAGEGSNPSAVYLKFSLPHCREAGGKRLTPSSVHAFACGQDFPFVLTCSCVGWTSHPICCPSEIFHTLKSEEMAKSERKL